MDDESSLLIAPHARESAPVSLLGAKTTHELVRYFLASLVALVVDGGLLVLLTTYTSLGYLVSGAISFSLGLIVIYLLSVTWVFDARAVKSRGLEFSLFASIGVIGLLLNELILWLLTDYAGWFYLASKVASVAVVFTWNFIARKSTLFSSYE